MYLVVVITISAISRETKIGAQHLCMVGERQLKFNEIV